MTYLLSKARLAVVIVLTGFLFACASTAVNHGEMILGKWDTELQGFPLTLDYNGTDIEVIGMGQSLPYSIEGDVIKFDFMGPRSARVAFPEKGQMTQTDIATSEITTFKRNGE